MIHACVQIINVIDKKQKKFELNAPLLPNRTRMKKQIRIRKREVEKNAAEILPFYDLAIDGAAVPEYASCCNAIRLTHAISQVQHKKIKENGQPYRTYLLSSNHSASEVSIDVDRWQQHVYTRGHGTPQRRCNRPTQPATVCNLDCRIN